MVPILFIVVKAAATFFFLSVLFMASDPPWWSASIHNVTDSRVAALARNMRGRAHSVGLCKALREGRFAICGNPLFLSKETPCFLC